jgi:hypothetical protein
MSPRPRVAVDERRVSGGSGNFLYLGLRALKDIEHRVNVEAEALGPPRLPGRRPEAVLGLELNPSTRPAPPPMRAKARRREL